MADTVQAVAAFRQQLASSGFMRLASGDMIRDRVRIGIMVTMRDVTVLQSINGVGMHRECLSLDQTDQLDRLAKQIIAGWWPE